MNRNTEGARRFAYGRRRPLKPGRRRAWNSTLAPRSAKEIERRRTWDVRKRELFARDPVCQFPGCIKTWRDCDPHHILSGGGDDLGNLVALCRGILTPDHHDWVHMNRRAAERLGLRKSGARSG